MQVTARGRCIKHVNRYESKYPMKLYIIHCYYRDNPKGRQKIGHQLIWAHDIQEAKLRSDTWHPLIISIEEYT